MQANVLDLEGKAVEKMQLPTQFDSAIRPDLIRRAVHAQASLRLQPKGNFPLAGMQSTAEYFGRRHRPRSTINTGRSRLPREKLAGQRLGRVRLVPHSMGGRRAHPPKVLKNLVEKINFKERNQAICSSIAATASADAVKGRGHKFDGLQLPIIISNTFEGLKRTKDAVAVLSKLGLNSDLLRASEGRRMRSGRSRLRKGGYRTPKSILIIYGKQDGIWKATRNIPGVDAVPVDRLDAELLAPGGVAGRLTVWTKPAILELETQHLYQTSDQVNAREESKK
jgi:large subunit ribosomal protein L4e